MTTETTQHITPGPWVVYRGPMNMDGGLNPFFRGIVALLKHAGEEDDIAVILDRNESAADYEANARLIAAAPELLAALEQAPEALVSYDTYFDWFREVALPAIVKARGTG